MRTTEDSLHPSTVVIMLDVVNARQSLHDAQLAMLDAQSAFYDAQATGDRDAIADTRDDLGLAEAAHARAEYTWFRAVESALVEAPTTLPAHVSTAP